MICYFLRSRFSDIIEKKNRKEKIKIEEHIHIVILYIESLVILFVFSLLFQLVFLLSQVKHVRRETTGSNGFLTNFGSSIPTGTFSDFSDDFRSVPTGKYRQLAGIHRKNLKSFRSEYCFRFRGISGAFLRDTVTFPHLSCRILRDTMVGILDLGLLY